MNAGAPTGKRNQEQKMQTLRPFGRLGAGGGYEARADVFFVSRR